MAIYTQALRRARDPNSGTPMDMTVVWEDHDPRHEREVTPYQVAYCPRPEDAERIKAALVWYGEYGVAHGRREAPAAVPPADALFAFGAWLSGRPEAAGPFSSQHDMAPLADLLGAYCRWHGWEVSRGYPDNVKQPPYDITVKEE